VHHCIHHGSLDRPGCHSASRSGPPRKCERRILAYLAYHSSSSRGRAGSCCGTAPRQRKGCRILCGCPRRRRKALPLSGPEQGTGTGGLLWNTPKTPSLASWASRGLIFGSRQFCRGLRSRGPPPFSPTNGAVKGARRHPIARYGGGPGKAGAKAEDKQESRSSLQQQASFTRPGLSEHGAGYGHPSPAETPSAGAVAPSSAMRLGGHARDTIARLAGLLRHFDIRQGVRSTSYYPYPVSPTGTKWL